MNPSTAFAVAQFPSIYRQGPGALAELPALLDGLNVGSALVLCGASARAGAASAFGGATRLEFLPFTGECTGPELDRVAEKARAGGHGAIVGLGGGKVIDAARGAAHLAGGLPFVSAPTVASTDAPTSATTVIYRADGTFESYLRSRNPAAVLVDTAIIARAPVRYLVAGMGDALSTWFEAESCRRSGAPNVCGGRATLAAGAIARLCLDTIVEDGPHAVTACRAGVVTPALDRVVEANTLLSGLGFESGGLAAAHAIHNGLTRIHACHGSLHGEKVAFGVLVGLVFTGAPAERVEGVLRFCRSVGLPVCMADLGCPEPTDAELREAAEAACAPGESIHNEAVLADPDRLREALVAADHIGREFAGR